MKDRSLSLKLFTFPQLSTIFIHNSTMKYAQADLRCVHGKFTRMQTALPPKRAVLSPILANSDEFLPSENRMNIFAISAEFCSKIETLFL